MEAPYSTKDTRSRDWIISHAQARPVEALQIAGAIQSPWFRCQAFAHLGLVEQDQIQKMRLVEAAFNAADETVEPNRVVKVSAWPLKVLVIFGDEEEISKQLRRLLAVISGESSPVRRADALFEVLGALALGPTSLFGLALHPFVQACQSIRGAKGDWMLRHMYPIADRVDAILGAELLSRIKKPTQIDLATKEAETRRSIPLSQLCPWPNIGNSPLN